MGKIYSKKKVVLAALWILSVMWIANFKSIEVSAETTEDGKFSYTLIENDTEVQITRFLDEEGYQDVVIPNKIDEKPVTSIGNGAFADCYYITHVTIPDTVTFIDEGAFNGCSLTGITLSRNLVTIGDRAFQGCEELSEIVLPEGIKQIGQNAFNNTAITQISIPEGVECIEFGTFGRCYNLKKLTFPNSLVTIEYGAFYDCDLDDVVIPQNVSTIHDGAFADCSVKSITVDDKNKVFDSRNDCNAIIKTATNTIIAGFKVTSIPETVTAIGSEAFSGQQDIESIVIPESITQIGSSAFDDCVSLKVIVIPNSVKEIGMAAFSTCSNLVSVTLSKSITTISKSLFEDCVALENITIPNSVTTIDNNAFGNCIGLKSITIPETVTLINNCFTNVPKTMVCYVKKGSYAETIAKSNLFVIKDITESPTYEPIPSDEPEDTLTGKQDNSSESVVLPKEKGTLLSDEVNKCKVKVISADKDNPTVEYVGLVNSNAKKVVIPSTVKVEGVTYTVIGIADKAFQNKKITQIVVPDTVTTIGKSAFKKCKKLTKVVIGTGVVTIKASSFENCDALKTITIKSKTLTSIGVKAFKNCKKLTKITLATTKLTKKSVGKNALKNTNSKLVVKVPKSKVKAYKKYFSNKGNRKVRVKK